MFSFGDVGSQGPGTFVTRMSATNTQASAMENFMFQAAVPKVSNLFVIIFFKQKVYLLVSVPACIILPKTLEETRPSIHCLSFSFSFNSYFSK